MNKKLKKIILPILLISIITTSYFVFLKNDLIKEARAGYLQMTETTDYFHVQSDTYGIRFYKNDADAYMRFYDGASTQVAYWHGPNMRLADSSLYRAIRDTAAREVTLPENNKSRIVLKMTGKFNDAYNSSGNDLTDGSDDVTYEIYFYIYPEYYFHKISINAYDGVNLVDNTYTGSDIISITQSNHFFDSGELYYGTTTGEVFTTNYDAFVDKDYVSAQATSTPDWLALKISDTHSGTTTLTLGGSTEATTQAFQFFYDGGNLKGISETVFAVRPKINTTASSRQSWVQKMLAFDSSVFSVGASVNDLTDEIYDTYTPDGTTHVSADNNKAEFTVHANATNTWAVLSATSTAGSQSLSIGSNQGFEDPNGTSSSWAYLGNRKSYGSFDVNDPDVLFYWDMNSTTTGQAPNKGVGTIEVNGQFENNEGVSGNSIGPPTTWDNISISNKNFNPTRGSIAFWYKDASSTDSNDQYPVFHGSTWQESLELRVGLDGSDRIDVVLNGVTTINNYVTLGDEDLHLHDEEWHFWRINYDAEEDLTELYIDGRLLESSNISFEPLALSSDVHLFNVSGVNYLYVLDEFYISSDPDQPDAPSYYDVIKYTDISSGSLTGIPEFGAGSMKWNHPIASPIWQTQREDPVFTVHDWSPRTRSTSTGELFDHLVLDLPLDATGSNADAGKVYDKVSGTWMGSINGSGVSFKQGVQGDSLRVNPSGNAANYIKLPSSSMNSQKGTIEFDYRYLGGSKYYDAMFGIGGLNSEFSLQLGSDGDWCFNYNGSETNCVNELLVDDGEWHHIRITWDQLNSFYSLLFDNDFVSTSTSISEATFDTDLFIGDRSFNNGGRPMHGQIDNFKVYNDVILPFGAYYTGEPNDGHYSGAHPDVSFYDDMTSVTNGYSPKIGSGTVTVSNSPTLVTGIDGTANSAVDFDAGTEYLQIDNDDIDVNQGRVGFWYKPTAASSDGDTFLSFENSGTTVINFYRSLINGSLRMTYNGQSFNSDALTWSTNTWYWIEYVWDAVNNIQKIYLNNEEVMSGTVDITVPTFDSVFIGKNQWGDAIDGAIDELYITNSPDTPMIPTAFGKPLLVPQVAIDENGKNNLKIIETDYDIAPLNEITSWLVSYNGTLTDDTTFLITETLNAAQLSDASVPLDRIHPLIHTSYTSGYSTITVQRGNGQYSDDFKLVFSEADAGVSSCYLGQGTAGSWGSNLCSATNLLTEVDQNSVIQTDQTSTLNLLQDGGVEAIVRNVFVLTGEATTTEEWHIFADGSVVIDRKYEKDNSNQESRSMNSEFSNNTYYPATPDVNRDSGVYHDSLFLNLKSINTDLQTDYLNPVKGSTSTISGLQADMSVDYDADGFAESYGVYTIDANYVADPSIPECPGTCGQPIYHTIGTTTATVNVTTASVDTISTGLFLVKFSGSPDLSGIHRRDKFKDGTADATVRWNIISVDDQNDQIIVGDQEVNGGAPSSLNASQATVGPWYTSLAAWESGEDRDLTSSARYPNGEIEMAECWPMKDVLSSTRSIDGWTTARNNYIKIYTPLSERHKGVFSEDYYNIHFDELNIAFDIQENYVQIDGIQIKHTRSGENYPTTFSQMNLNWESFLVYSNNIMVGDFDGVTGVGFARGWDNNGGPQEWKRAIVNNIIIGYETINGETSRVVCGCGTNSDTHFYHNTIYNCEEGVRVYTGNIYRLKNNIFNNCSDAISGSGAPHSSSDYNIADSGDAPGNNSKSCTVSFVSTSTGDLHLADDDTCAKGYGVKISPPLGEIVPTGQRGLFHDIEGQPRGTTWDIGADQIVEKYSNKFKIELDSSAQTLYSPRFLIQDFYPQVGKRGSEDDLIVTHLPMDSVINTEYVYDKITGTSTFYKINNYNNINVKQSIRNNGIEFLDSSSASLTFTESESGINREKGAISFWYTPTTDSVTGGATFFKCAADAWYQISRFNDDLFYFYFGPSPIDAGVDFVKNEPVQVLVTWYHDGDKYYRYASVNDVREEVVINDDSLPAVTDDICYIGSDSSGGSNMADGIIDDFKIYSEPILPFGAYYTGYEQNGNYLNADPNLVFYWDAESDKALVGRHLLPKDVTVMGSQASLSEDESIYGNRSLKFKGVGWAPTRWMLDSQLDYSKGCYSYWFNASETSDDPHLVGFWLNNSNQIRNAYYSGSGQLQVAYVGNSTYSYIGLGSIESDAWYHIRVCWDNDEGKFWAYKNGMRNDQTINAIWNVSNTPYIRIGSFDGSTNVYDTFVDQVFVTNNPYAEEIPTAFGRPLNMPLMKVDNTRQRLGYDYWASWTPDPSSIILQYFKNISGASVFEVGASEGEAQIRKLKGGIRLQGGVRF